MKEVFILDWGDGLSPTYHSTLEFAQRRAERRGGEEIAWSRGESPDWWYGRDSDGDLWSINREVMDEEE